MAAVEFSVVRRGPIACAVGSTWHPHMRLAPKRGGNLQGLDRLALPPGALATLAVELAVVQPADGYREPVADFPPHRPRLCKLDMVGIRGGSAADETGLRGYKLQVFAVALPHWFADHCDHWPAVVELC